MRQKNLPPSPTDTWRFLLPAHVVGCVGLDGNSQCAPGVSQKDRNLFRCRLKTPHLRLRDLAEPLRDLHRFWLATEAFHVHSSACRFQQGCSDWMFVSKIKPSCMLREGAACALAGGTARIWPARMTPPVQVAIDSPRKIDPENVG